MRVLVLMHEDLIPPCEINGEREWTDDPWKTEYDVLNGLKDLSIETLALGVRDDLGLVRTALYEFKPDIVFNLLEEFADEAIFDQNVVSYLELLRVKYTGCSPRGLMLARDKSISKKILKYHGIPTPDFWVFPNGRRVRIPADIVYPLFVKSVNEEASLGISQSSIVNNRADLIERIEFYHSKYEVDVIAENYIEGRELYVSVLGNERLKVMPVWELKFGTTPASVHRVATSNVKWSAKYRARYSIDTGPANLTEANRIRIEEISKKAYGALGLNGYARLDFRMTNQNEFYLLEANPNPNLCLGEDFAASCKAGGLTYPQMIETILNIGLRWKPKAIVSGLEKS